MLKRRRTKQQMSAPLTDEQRDLAGRYFPFALKFAARRSADYPSMTEDIYSSCLLSLVLAARDFRADKGLKFATFLRWRTWQDLKGLDRGPGAVPFSSIGVDLGHFAQLADEHDDIGRIDDEESASRWLRKLPVAHAKALRLVAIDGHSQAAAGAMMGRPQAGISRLIAESRQLLGA